jgi:phosphatase NudJ
VGVTGREPIPTWFFALAVVRREDQFVLVHETKHGQLHSLPGGRAEPGETLAQAALRETLEEAGIPVVLEGLLRLEHSPSPHDARVRAIFLARPADDTPLKRVKDEHSQRANWVRLDELSNYPLRGEEVRELFEYVARGGPVFPLEVISLEGEPWR